MEPDVTSAFVPARPARTARDEDSTTRVYHRNPSPLPSIEIELTDLGEEDPSVTAKIPAAELRSLLSHSKAPAASQAEPTSPAEARAVDGGADAITLGELEDFRKQLVSTHPPAEAPAGALSEPAPSMSSAAEIEAAQEPALTVDVEPEIVIEPESVPAYALARVDIACAPVPSPAARALAVLRVIRGALFGWVRRLFLAASATTRRSA